MSTRPSDAELADAMDTLRTLGHYEVLAYFQGAAAPPAIGLADIYRMTAAVDKLSASLEEATSRFEHLAGAKKLDPPTLMVRCLRPIPSAVMNQFNDALDAVKDGFNVIIPHGVEVYQLIAGGVWVPLGSGDYPSVQPADEGLANFHAAMGNGTVG